MTDKERNQFVTMANALHEIRAYASPEKLRKQSAKEYGLDYEEALEMAYENILETAKQALKGIRSTASN